MKSLLFYPAFVSLLLMLACGGETPQNEDAATMAADSGQTPLAQSEAPAPQFPAYMRPIVLEGVETQVDMQAAYDQMPSIDSVVAPPGIQASLKAGESQLNLTVVGDPGQLSALRIWSGGECRDVLLQRPLDRKKQATLRLRDKGYDRVRVKGAMNGWDPAKGEMTLKNGIWEYSFSVEPGDYPYLFVADGQEILDPKNPNKTTDGKGGNYSLLTLAQPESSRSPSLAVQGIDGDRIRLRLSRPGSVLVFWENQLLPTTREGELFSFSIPESAGSLPQSSIRAYGQNEFGASEELRIPLVAGSVAAAGREGVGPCRITA